MSTLSVVETLRYSVRKKLLISLFIIVFLTPIAWALIAPYENWPYTSVPLFGGYVDLQSDKYSMTFLGEFENSKAKEIDYYTIGAHWSLKRHFFKYVYGSVERYSVFNIYPNDTKEDFENRLSKFFGVIAREQQSQQRYVKSPVQKIRLQVHKLDWDNKPIETHEVGIYDSRTGRFTHTWGK